MNETTMPRRQTHLSCPTRTSIPYSYLLYVLGLVAARGLHAFEALLDSKLPLKVTEVFWETAAEAHSDFLVVELQVLLVPLVYRLYR